MELTGKALCLGDHIDTDAIIPARFLVTFDAGELGAHCMSGYDPQWVEKVTPNASIIVAGKNFGCGSSREHAPVAILGAGIHVVLAHSFARIFYRNAFNMGLLPLEIGDAYTKITEGDELVIDSEKGSILNKTTGETIVFTPLLPTMKNILEKGGLAPYVKDRLNQ